MPIMKTSQPVLPIPDPAQFCTRRAAAARLGTTEQTIGRWIRRGRLKSYTVRHVPHERAPILLSCAEVDDLAAALRLVKGNSG